MRKALQEEIKKEKVCAYCVYCKHDKAGQFVCEKKKRFFYPASERFHLTCDEFVYFRSSNNC